MRRSPHPGRTSRRGSITVEFAFSMPIVLVMLLGVLEWGWLLGREVAIVQVAREAAHAGARAHSDDDPAAVAGLRARADLQTAGFDADDATITTSLSDSGTEAGEVVDVQIRHPYEPMVGLIPTPDDLFARATFRLEHQ